MYRSLNPTPTRLVFLLAALVGGGAACGSDPATEISATPETVSFDGTSVETLEIEADGAWDIDVSDAWITADPPAGSGSADVELRIDYDDLEPGEASGTVTVFGEASTSVPILARFPEVRGTVESSGGHLASRARGDERPAPLEAPHREGQLLVGLSRGMVALSEHGDPNAEPTREAMEATAERLGARVGATSASLVAPELGIARVDLDRAAELGPAIERLEAEGAIRYAEPNSLLEPLAVNDPFYEEQWHYERIGLEDAWDVTTGFEDVVVAVIDGDFHPDHPDLVENLLPGWDFVNDSGDLYVFNDECNAHGSHVAGTVAAVTDNDIGVAGVAPDVQVIPLNVGLREEDEDPEAFPCQLDSEAIIRAIRYAAGLEDDAAGGIDEPVDVMNISLGGPRSAARADALALARDEGVITVAAAGNSAGGPVGYPAALNTTIAVSATDHEDEIAPYSSIGDEVWVAAPGGDLQETIEGPDGDEIPAGVLSTVWVYDPADGNPDHGFGYRQGTSMASPHVAGVVALMRSVNPHLGPGEAQTILAETADDLDEDVPTPELGHGLVDAEAAVRAARDGLEVEPEQIVVRLMDGDEVVAEASADASGAFELGQVPGGEYTLVAGDERGGEQGAPGTVLGEESVQVVYEGDLEVSVNVSPQ